MQMCAVTKLRLKPLWLKYHSPFQMKQTRLPVVLSETLKKIEQALSKNAA